MDPFAGSSTTGIAASLTGRRFLGIEREAEFVGMSRARREELEDYATMANYRGKIKDIVATEAFVPSCFAGEERPVADLPF